MKFKQQIGDADFQNLKSFADSKEISVQELIRSVIVPDWLRKEERLSRNNRMLLIEEPAK